MDSSYNSNTLLWLALVVVVVALILIGVYALRRSSGPQGRTLAADAVALVIYDYYTDPACVSGGPVTHPDTVTAPASVDAGSKFTMELSSKAMLPSCGGGIDADVPITDLQFIVPVSTN